MKHRIYACIVVSAALAVALPLLADVIPLSATAPHADSPEFQTGTVAAPPLAPGRDVPGCEGFDDGLPGDPWDFEGDEIIIVDGHLQMHNPLGLSTTSATLTLDVAEKAAILLAAEGAPLHVLLTFSYMSHGEDPDPADGVFLGGTKLYDLGDTDGEWTDVAIYVTDLVPPETSLAPVEIVFQQRIDKAWPSDGVQLDDVCVGVDCQRDGLLDVFEIEANPTLDCDTNGVKDECQDEDDCNSNGIPDFCDAWPGFADPADPEETPAPYWITHKLLILPADGPSAFPDDAAQYWDLKALEEANTNRKFDAGETFLVETWVTNSMFMTLERDTEGNVIVPGIIVGSVDVEVCGDCELTVMDSSLEHGASLNFGFPTGSIEDCPGGQTDGRVVAFGGATPGFQPRAMYHGYHDWEWILVGRFAVTMPEVTCLGGICGDAPAGVVSIVGAQWSLFGQPVPADKNYFPPVESVTTRCPAWMYDMDANGYIDFVDLLTPVPECDGLSFAEAWLCCAPEDCYCWYFDWDCDDCIGPGDLGYWGTGYNHCCDEEPPIVLPPDWPGCGPTPSPSLVAPADDAFIQSLGLPLPPEDWSSH